MVQIHMRRTKAAQILTVQRASRSFWRSLAGQFAHSAGMRPSLMSRFSAAGVAPLRRSDDRGVNDLAAHRQKLRRRQHRIEALDNLDCRLAGLPASMARVSAARKVQIVLASGIGSAEPAAEAEEAHERQPVADQVFRCAGPTGCG